MSFKIATLKLQADVANHMADDAARACRYWDGQDGCDTLPNPAELREALSRNIPITAATQLTAIANMDLHSTDVCVQLALFGEVRYG
jgi:hypothetical protein